MLVSELKQILKGVPHDAEVDFFADDNNGEGELLSKLTGYAIERGVDGSTKVIALKVRIL